jgi:hypothetical protein
MPESIACEFLLLQYAPDGIGHDRVNLAVVLAALDGSFADVRFTRSWETIQRHDPDADIELLQSLERELKSELPQDRASILYRLDDCSNTVTLAQRHGVLAQDPAAELDKLSQIYLRRLRRAPASRTSGERTRLVRQLRSAFEAAGVWALMRKKIAASEFGTKGDPLKIDCGYKPNGTIRMFHALALPDASETDAHSAKALAFSYPAMRAGIAQIWQSESELTAIIEYPAQDNERAAFALDVLAQAHIRIATPRDLPALAEQARTELFRTKS